jgi:hypothetical protein
MLAVVLICSAARKSKKDLSWKSTQKILVNPTQFIYRLQNFNVGWTDDIMNLIQWMTS